jgi:hypothetical protein
LVNCNANYVVKYPKGYLLLEGKSLMVLGALTPALSNTSFIKSSVRLGGVLKKCNI